MVPTFILTRTFAISALFVGAAPLAAAAPISNYDVCYGNTPCAGTQYTSWSSVYTFLANLLEPTPQHSQFRSSELAAAEVFEPDIVSGILGGLEDTVDAFVPKVKAREDGLSPIIRDYLDLEAREPEPEPSPHAEAEALDERTCPYVAMCRRDGDPETPDKENGAT